MVGRGAMAGICDFFGGNGGWRLALTPALSQQERGAVDPDFHRGDIWRAGAREDRLGHRTSVELPTGSDAVRGVGYGLKLVGLTLTLALSLRGRGE